MGELMEKKAKREKVDGIGELVKVWDEEVFRPRELRIWIDTVTGDGPGVAMQELQGHGSGNRGMGKGSVQHYEPPPDVYDDSNNSHSCSNSHSPSQYHGTSSIASASIHGHRPHDTEGPGMNDTHGGYGNDKRHLKLTKKQAK